MPPHSTYSSSVDVATGAALSYGFDFPAGASLQLVPIILRACSSITDSR